VDWLADTRGSYDEVADNYHDMTRDLLDAAPYERAALALFADQVRAAGGGPVADVGCGAGRITAVLRGHGVDAFGIDLSPAMIKIARREQPGVRFEVGSMTELTLADASLAGLIAWYSTIHVPDEEIGTVLAHFHRVLRPGGRLLLCFHAGEETRQVTQAYGRSVNVEVHRRAPDRMAAWLARAGFTVEAQTTVTSPESRSGCITHALVPR
jgi:ubiquinone/menaquinone biosynthesis C-methylase UbiE